MITLFCNEKAPHSMENFVISGNMGFHLPEKLKNWHLVIFKFLIVQKLLKRVHLCKQNFPFPKVNYFSPHLNF